VPPFDAPDHPVTPQITGLGHIVQTAYAREIDEDSLDIRPSIAITKAHLKMSELDEAVRKGTLEVEGKIVMKSHVLENVDGSPSDAEPGVEVLVSKAGIEPVWYLPGVAERFGISESHCSRTLEACTPSSSRVLTSRSSFRRSVA